ncbi:MAG: hypothetical protein HFI10_13860 [Lachnospiraceae bacterium]|jgi:stage III sporulation protein AE|nr:hypothetical protein [Lachnospiraceae bacterium]
MKKHMLLFGLLCCLLFFGMSHIKSRAFDAEEEDAAAITKELPAEDISGELNRLWNENYMQEITDYLDDTYGKSEINTGELWQDIMRGNLRGSIKEFGARAVKNLFFEFSAGREIFMNILLLAVLSALFTVVMDIVENQQVSHLGFYFLYLLLCIMLSRVFRSIYVETEEILSSVTDFVKILIPAYAAALGMTNGSATATVYYEGILFVIWCVEEVLCHVALPGIELYMLLAVMNGVWTGERLGGILQSLKRGIELLLKGVLWIVGSLGVLQAMITPVIDSLKWNTAKKVAGMVPGVGNISEGISDIFVGSAILIRNGVGVFFTIMLLFLCLVPLCKMFVLSGCLKLSSALGAVVNHSRLTTCSDKVAEASFLLCKVLLTGMGLFLLSIAVSVLAVSRNM